MGRNINVFICGFALVLAGCMSARQEGIQTDLVKVSADIQQLADRLGRVESKLKRMNEDFEKLERVTSQSKADQSVQIEDVKIENKSLQGTLEILKHDLSQAVSENQKFREDFDYRINDLERKVASGDASPSSAPNADSKKKSVSDTARYAEIMEVFQSKKSYVSAAQQFKAFTQEYPKSKLAPSAQFWAGESFYAQKKFSDAIKEYQTVVDKYPAHEKSCDATYKQGLSFVELKKTDNAKLFLKEALEKCSGADMRKKIQRALQKLK